jgi:hypothetical protein
VHEIDTVVEELERLADDEAREKARSVVRAVLDLHAAGLAVVLDALRRSGGDSAVTDVAREQAVGGMLMLHGLHPIGAEARAREALARIERTLRTMHVSAEVVGVVEGVLRVRVEERGPAKGAIAAIEDALCEATPDAAVEIDRSAAPAPQSIVPVDRLRMHARSRRATAAEHCELCGDAIVSAHEHLVDPLARELKCACGACAVLFDSPRDGRWKRVPRRARRLAGFRMTDEAWSALGIPIDLAFFYRSSAAERVVALYPGPAGATESLLSLDAWTRLEADNPDLSSLIADVEALLVRRGRGADEYYRVSIDACYALVGHIRKHWRGLSGGTEAWSRIGAFFDDLKREPEGARA